MVQVPKKMKCISNNDGRLKVNKIYDVTQIHGSNFIRLIDETGDNIVTMVERFEEVKQ